jgi:hypothetical protein
MRYKLLLAALLAWAGVAFVLGSAAAQPAKAGDAKLQVQLLWGTTNSVSPDPKHKPVDVDVAKKLKQLPLKWSNYFVVNKKNLEVPPAAAKKEPISEKCAIEVKDLGKSMFEITLFGRGEKVVKRTQALPVGEILALGGNAPNETSWLVVVKRLE